MQNRKREARPASAASQPSIDWRRVVSAACLRCDWTTIARTALGSPELAAMVGEAFRMIGTTIERDIVRADAQAAAAARATMPPPPPPAEPIEASDEEPADAGAPPRVDTAADETPVIVVDEKAANAASLLGVDVAATEDEIRAALRGRLSSSKLHPDHGGDGEEAKQLIAAKNLLVERARARRT